MREEAAREEAMREERGGSGAARDAQREQHCEKGNTGDIMAQEQERREGVSSQTDELASTLMGAAFDLLAADEPFEVLLAVQDASGEVLSYEFEDDGPEACLDGARDSVRSNANAVRYALAYEGAVEIEPDTYADAVLLEFGEKGYRAYSAYSLFEGRGTGDGFTWSDPAPAGEMEPLL